jgi:tRNA (guanosine-2'-O-)-methyltransferase
MITESREKKFKDTIAKRQFDLTVILENVHDPHNIGAVLRTCDSVGVSEVFIKAPDKFNTLKEYMQNSPTSMGAAKWIQIHFFREIHDCLSSVKKKGYVIYGTHLDEQAKSLYTLDLSQKVALLFGNEHAGITEEALKYVESNFIIPQVGLVQSLNISVACAVSLYEAYRQREAKGRYAHHYSDENNDFKNLYNRYVAIHRGIKLNNK